MFKTKKEFLTAVRSYFGLTESVRVSQSYEALRREISDALNRWAARPTADMYVDWTFSDRIIAYSWTEDEARAWEIAWSRGEDGEIIFGDAVEVKQVVLYEPVSESAGGERQRFAEEIIQPLTLIQESGDDASGKVRAVGITAGVVNKNKRRYARSVLATAIAELNGHLHESAGQGRLIATGEVEHPSDKSGRGRPSLLETVVKWEAASLDAGGMTLLEGTILPTSKGSDILVMAEHGVPIGVSMRGYGAFELVQESGQTVQEVKELVITGFDLVAEPSDPNAQLLESINFQEETEEMNLEELLTLLKEKPEMREAVMANLGLADKNALAESLGVGVDELKSKLEEGAQAQAEIEERKRQDAIATAIEEATGDLPYSEQLNEKFIEAVRAADPADAEAVASLVESKRKEWDGIMADKELGSMGFGGDVEVRGPVFEKETGQPQFVLPAYQLSESMHQLGEGYKTWKPAKPANPNERYAAAVLKRFDELHKEHLIAESQRFEEANTTSDLDLPYSVSRSIIAEALPQLVAMSIFDVGVTNQSPSRIYFETYEAETGVSNAVTDESIAADEGAWVDLEYTRALPGTVVVTTDPAGTTYVEGTDYLIKYNTGQIMTLAAGSISDADDLLVDYTYLAYRKGEMAEIERGKMTLSHKTLEVAADRLATQISKEAVVFSRAQLGYDVTGRTLGMLATKVRQKIDQDIFYEAIAAVLQTANNSGGTFTVATDALDDLVKYIGYARVKLANRYYQPNAVVMSVTNADILSNWDNFTAAGKRPDADLDAAGYVGRVKSLPVFTSTEFPDGYVLVTNRQLVMHRVFQPMNIFGPFPTYGANRKLIAANQYYIEEFNGTDAPIVEKGAYVRIA